MIKSYLLGNNINRDSLFRIGSITKIFTATIVLLYVQINVISLDDPISKYISYKNGNKITIKMLLQHTSGIPFDGKKIDENPYIFIRKMEKEPFLFPPNIDYSYSNTGYILLGIILEQVTGTSWEMLVYNHIINKLSLQNTYIYTEKYKKYIKNGYRLNCGDTREYPCDTNKHFIIQEIKESKDWIGSYSAGCMISNSNDLIVFLTNLLRGKIINNYYVSLMKEPSFQSLYTKNHKPDNVVGYGMGLMLYNLYEYGYGYGHTGIIPGFKAMVFYSQTYNSFFSLCANFFNIYSMSNLLKNILYNYSRNTINNSLLRTTFFNKKYRIPSMYISIYKNNNSCIITRNIVLLCLITILYISYKYCKK